MEEGYAEVLAFLRHTKQDEDSQNKQDEDEDEDDALRHTRGRLFKNTSVALAHVIWFEPSKDPHGKLGHRMFVRNPDCAARKAGAEERGGSGEEKREPGDEERKKRPAFVPVSAIKQVVHMAHACTMKDTTKNNEALVDTSCPRVDGSVEHDYSSPCFVLCPTPTGM